MKSVEKIISILNAEITELSLHEKIDAINQIKVALHKVSPFISEPVDCVLWVKREFVNANDYNPNNVGKAEFQLLEHSILKDGFTQPIVSMLENNESREVVDGFHRNLVGRNHPEIHKRVFGYLPVTTINQDRTERSDRIASTIRHNRARGKHKVDAMSEIVVELSRRNWNDEKIAKELGMDADEVLRLKQVSGLAELFADKEFSQAWEI